MDQRIDEEGKMVGALSFGGSVVRVWRAPGVGGCVDSERMVS